MHRKPETFIRQPNYPGGKKALDEFIRQNLRYPEDAARNKVEGTVTVDIDIDVFGKVTSAKIKHGIGYGCDEEALRLAGLLQFEKKRYRGLFVTFHRTINIHFRLHQASKPLGVSWEYTKKPQAGGYSYTIKIDRKNP